MVAELPNPKRPLRLSPFIFPSDTDFRFVLLVVSVLGATLFIYRWLFVGVFSQEFITVLQQCLTAQKQAIPPLSQGSGLTSSDSMAQTERWIASNTALQACLYPFEFKEGLWMLGGAIGVLALAGGLYLLAPTLNIRRNGFEPISVAEFPDIHAALAELVRKAGLRSAPTFLWAPLQLASSGVAFGHFRRYYVALTGGLVTQFYSDQSSFRAIVLHELAHLRNGDVDKTYFAVAVWQAFLLVAVIPFGINGVFLIYRAEFSAFELGLIGCVLALGLFVLLVRNGVLRAREFYADVRAATWLGSAAPLQHVLAQLLSDRGGYLRRALQLHPDSELRSQTVNEPERLFRLGFWDAFATGIATTISFPSVVELINFLLPSGYEIVAFIIAMAVFAPLATSVLGLGIWRQTFAGLHTSRKLAGVGQLSVGLALGMTVGYLISFDIVQQLAFFSSAILAAVLAPAVLLGWACLLFLGLYCCNAWLQQSASIWLPVTTTPWKLRVALVMSLLIAGLLMTLWLGVLFGILNGGMLAVTIVSAFNVGYSFSIFGPTAIMLAALIGIWAFPFGAALVRRSSPTSDGHWMLLDHAPLLVPPLPRERPQVRLALLTGIGAGIVFILLFLPLYLQLRQKFPDLQQLPESVTEWFAGWFLLRGELVQVGAAVVLAVFARRLRVIHGLFAAFVASCATAVGIELMYLALGKGIDLSTFWSNITRLTVPGGLVALPITALTALLAQRFPQAMRAGLIIGLIDALLIIIANSSGQLLAVTQSAPAADQITSMLNGVGILNLAVVILLQIGVALWVIRHAPRWGITQGVLGAVVAGLAPMIAMLMLSQESTPFQLLFQLRNYVLIGPGLALGACVIAALTGTVVRRIRRGRKHHVATGM